MATDMIDSEVVLKAAADNNVMSLNNSPDTPRIYESPGGDIRDTPSLSSHSEDLQNSSTELSLEKGEEAAGAALHRPTQTGGPPQETVTPDNGEKHEERVEMVPCSVPVRIPQTYSTSGHNGRYECTSHLCAILYTLVRKVMSIPIQEDCSLPRAASYQCYCADILCCQCDSINYYTCY